ncbi:hypothetical protein MHYP_G00338190 [Metynnis hypsauchen]
MPRLQSVPCELALPTGRRLGRVARAIWDISRRRTPSSHSSAERPAKWPCSCDGFIGLEGPQGTAGGDRRWGLERGTLLHHWPLPGARD